MFKISSNPTNKMQWQWMITFLFKSNLWFRNKNGSLLCNEVLNEIKKCEKNQSKKYLLKYFKNEKININKLKHINTKNNNNDNKYDIIRQDIINNGLKLKYTKNDLLSIKI